MCPPTSSGNDGGKGGRRSSPTRTPNPLTLSLSKGAPRAPEPSPETTKAASAPASPEGVPPRRAALGECGPQGPPPSGAGPARGELGRRPGRAHPRKGGEAQSCPQALLPPLFERAASRQGAWGMCPQFQKTSEGGAGRGEQRRHAATPSAHPEPVEGLPRSSQSLPLRRQGTSLPGKPGESRGGIPLWQGVWGMCPQFQKTSEGGRVGPDQRRNAESAHPEPVEGPPSPPGRGLG